MEEEGRLDFFFSNAGVAQIIPKGLENAKDAVDRLKVMARGTADISPEEYMETMRINSLRWVAWLTRSP